MLETAIFLSAKVHRIGIILLICLLATLLNVVAAIGNPTSSQTKTVHLLVLDNADSDFKVPPFNDSFLLLTSRGEVIRKTSNLNVCQKVGSSRPITISEDGQFFVVCENVADRLSAYDVETGIQLWSLQGPFVSASIAQGLTYALTSDGTIYGNGIQVIDRKGNVINKSALIRGQDITIDPIRNNVWAVGKDIKKCNMDLTAIQTYSSFTWCAVSADYSRDGSIWVAERAHVHSGGKDRLLKVSPQGSVMTSIPLDVSPYCVRVDHSDNSVWVTGITIRKLTRPSIVLGEWPPRITKRTKYKLGERKTYKYSAQGEVLLELKCGGWSLAVDPVDKSVWIADEAALLHFSKTGKKVNTLKSVSHDQKWLAIIPQQTKED